MFKVLSILGEGKLEKRGEKNTSPLMPGEGERERGTTVF